MKKKTERHAGYIPMSSKLLMEILDFKGGIIWGANLTDFGVLEILIEHPDLPLVKETEALQRIVLIHKATYAKNGVITRLERTDPPKSNGGASSKS